MPAIADQNAKLSRSSRRQLADAISGDGWATLGYRRGERLDVARPDRSTGRDAAMVDEAAGDRPEHPGSDESDPVPGEPRLRVQIWQLPTAQKIA